MKNYLTILLILSPIWLPAQQLDTLNVQTNDSNNLMAKLKKSETIIKQKTDSVTFLTRSILKNNALIKDLRQKISESESTIKMIKNENDSYLKDLVAVNNKVAGLEKNSSVLKDSVNHYFKEKISIKNNEINILKLDLQKERTTNNTEKRRLENEIGSKNSLLKIQKRDFAKLTSQYKSSIESISSLGSDLAKNIFQIDSLNLKLEAAGLEINEKTKMLKRNDEKLAKTTFTNNFFKISLIVTFVIICISILGFVIVTYISTIFQSEYFKIKESKNKIDEALFRQYNYLFRLSRLVRKSLPFCIGLSLLFPIIMIAFILYMGDFTLINSERIFKMIAAFFGPVIFLGGILNFIETNRTQVLKTIHELNTK